MSVVIVRFAKFVKLVKLPEIVLEIELVAVSGSKSLETSVVPSIFLDRKF